MASAVLASRNEPRWGEPKVYVRRHPNTTATLNNNINNTLFRSKPNTNLNRLTRAHDPSSNLHFKEIPFQAVTAELPSWKRKLVDPIEAKESSRAGHVTFNLGTYTRRELKDLKKRLFSDLERVRTLRIRIENSNFDALPTYPLTHQPSLPAPPLLQLPYATDPQKPSTNRTPKGRKKGRISKRVNPKVKRAATAPSTKNLLRRCGQILTKLMKHQHGWVFNAPVDVVSLRLHDYHAIIKKPMDLGTVKSNLQKNFYSSPLDFAEDVRLTFNNALEYNPKGHNVNVMAGTLLTEFEQMFNKLSQQRGILVTQGAALLKPKARVMSLEEKKILGRSLEELPQEEVVELLAIIKKRNGELYCDGDDIELNIDTLDNDTLWELDQFVGNYKSNPEEKPIYSQVQAQAPTAVGSEMMVIERSKKGEVVGEDDVDIGEEIPAENYPPVVIERDANSSSSSSGSDSSSSKGSESGSESDDYNVQSPFVEPAVELEV